MSVTIYTDGSCHNPGPGGWGCVLMHPRAEEPKIVGGFVTEQTTSARMEILAALEGLRMLTRPCNVELWTDSMYVINMGTKPYKARQNPDLVKELRDEVKRHNVTFKHVKGHTGDKWNEKAHEVALENYREAVKSVQAQEDKASSQGLEEWFDAYYHEFVSKALSSDRKVERLYPFVVGDLQPEPPRVTTPKGKGKLFIARSDTCLVQLDNEKEEGQNKGSTKKYKVMREFKTEDVQHPTLEELGIA